MTLLYVYNIDQHKIISHVLSIYLSIFSFFLKPNSGIKVTNQHVGTKC